MSLMQELLDQSEEGLVEINGEGFYFIPDVDRIPPFGMSVVSDSDHWMFASSNGAMTAGRGTSSRALFPYETDDRIHNAAGSVGPVTAIRAVSGDQEFLWQPFHKRPPASVRRSLYKSVVGDSVVFEETHLDLGLRFQYRWTTSDQFGFVRQAALTNRSDRSVRVEVIDGLVNILPYGLDPSVYQGRSNLTHAYKRSEVIDSTTRLAVFSLESGVVDRPDPAEVLRGTVVWSFGLPDAQVALSPDALSQFVAGDPHADSHLLTGRPGAYLLRESVALDAGQTTVWHIIADVAQDQAEVTELQHLLRTETDVSAAVAVSTSQASEALVRTMAPADALQRTGDRVATAHQFANVTYNVMRGGVPFAGYNIAVRDFEVFLANRNRVVAECHAEWLRTLPESLTKKALLLRISETEDPHLARLGMEYLPFRFARRHGDPSRPWNSFSIRVKDDHGQPVLYYEGNWRDIFQNWEALCMSFPEYFRDVISVFVNASTPDGFNPYRITSDGIDWEVPDSEDPWSNIGYWGDHQIVYLLRLLEASDRFFPGEVASLLGGRLFSYADVPYRIAPYEALVRDPKTTITYDQEAASSTAKRVENLGGDGRLLAGDGSQPHLVTLTEKLLVPALAKLSNFVPGGGIWMNTQRPEWNDANNALVGFGLSMVTLYHLRRYLLNLTALVENSGIEQISMSTEVVDWLQSVSAALSEHRNSSSRTDEARMDLMDDLGGAFDHYRSTVYGSGFSGETDIRMEQITELCEVSVALLDETIKTNRRNDGLYHSYNLVHFDDAGSSAGVEHLFEMLEGQVAVLESGVLSPGEQVELIDALFSSSMFREDQGSFMLYPARQLPSFLDKNVVPAEAVKSNPLLKRMVEQEDLALITVATDGRIRFNADFANREHLEAALDDLEGHNEWSGLVTAHRIATLETYEQVFGHHAYTGRSGSMYGYEGIGSIYWHMVAKLLVAVQEAAVESAASAPSDITKKLVDSYWRIRAGLGFNKTAVEFGAIPIDPYSHTPAHAGAQQPGMTGLVKEELLTRPLEVGVQVDDGQIRFDPILLRSDELLDSAESWLVYDLDLESREVLVGERSLGMTLCQVPVVVTVTTGEIGVDVSYADGTSERIEGLSIDAHTSAKIFARSGEVTQLHAFVPGGT